MIEAVRIHAAVVCLVVAAAPYVLASCKDEASVPAPQRSHQAAQEVEPEEVARLWEERENEESLRKAIAIYERQFEQEPSAPLCTRLSRAYYLLADVFLRGDKKESIQVHNKGTACAWAGLRLNEEFRRSIDDGQSVASAIGTIGQEHIGALFWWGAHLGRSLSHRGLLTQWRHRKRVVAMMKSIQALDERYFYGGVYRMWGVYYVRKRSMDKAAASFERAADIAPFFLMTRRMYALEYALPAGDRELFVGQLTLALEEPEPDAPDILRSSGSNRRWQKSF